MAEMDVEQPLGEVEPVESAPEERPPQQETSDIQVALIQEMEDELHNDEEQKPVDAAPASKKQAAPNAKAKKAKKAAGGEDKKKKRKVPVNSKKEVVRGDSKPHAQLLVPLTSAPAGSLAVSPNGGASPVPQSQTLPHLRQCANCAKMGAMMRELCAQAGCSAVESLQGNFNSVRQFIQTARLATQTSPSPILAQKSSQTQQSLRQELSRFKTEAARIQDLVVKSRLVFNRQQPLSQQVEEILRINLQRGDQIGVLTQENRTLREQNAALGRQKLSGQLRELQGTVRQVEEDLAAQQVQNDELQVQLTAALQLNKQLQENCLRFKELNDRLIASQSQEELDLPEAIKAQVAPGLEALGAQMQQFQAQVAQKHNLLLQRLQHSHEQLETAFVEVWRKKETRQ